MNILISDPVEAQCAEIFRSRGFHVDQKTGLSPADLKAIIPQYDVLIVRSQTKATAEIIEAGIKLKIIGRAGAGVDNIDVTAASRRGIIVMNTPGGNTISTAEHTISMMLSLARNIPQADKSVKEGAWERKKYVGIELYEKTLGVLGMGKVGKEVAIRCASFGMKIIAYDPMVSAESARELGIELVSVEELLKQADIITIHTPLIPETKYLLNEKSFALCKEGVRIINCARGGIVQESALLDALNSGQVGGAALDVFEIEPPGDLPLLKHPHLIATPHLGASTEEAQEKVALQIAYQVCDVLQGRGLAGGVNADVMKAAMRSDLQPYLVLAEKLGKLVAQMSSGKGSIVKLQTRGAILADAGPALSAGFVKGMMTTFLDAEEYLNLLNSPILARERGITLELQHTVDGEQVSGVITAVFSSGKGEHIVSGTVYGGKHVRLTSIDGFNFEANPEGNLLFYTNIDKPGVVAAVSTILAKACVNIAGMSLGRFGVGEMAITVMNVDSPIPQNVLMDIVAVEGLLDVQAVNL